MNNSKNILTVLFLFLVFISCKKTESESGNYQVLAKLISFEGGDKIHFAKFKTLKNVSGNLPINDTIIVGYFNYKTPEEDIDTVLLTIKKYDKKTSLKNYFICPDYDGKTNIQKTNMK